MLLQTWWFTNRFIADCENKCSFNTVLSVTVSDPCVCEFANIYMENFYIFTLNIVDFCIHIGIYIYTCVN